MAREEYNTIYLGKYELSPAKSLGNAPLQWELEHCRLNISPSSSSGELHFKQWQSNE